MIIAIIQARMGSTRFPGKTLKKIEGKTLLEHLVSRVKRAKTLDKIVVATTDKPEDKAIADAAKKLGVDYFCGSKEDVLDRYYQAAKKFGARIIVRVTGDCPVMDPKIIDDVVNFFKQGQRKFDYISNVHPPTFPDGMDVEIFSFKTLERVWREAKLKSEREHVTPYIYNHPEIFRISNVRNPKNLSHFRLTVDNPEDLALMRKIFKTLYKKNKYFNLQDILKFLDEKPKLTLINRHIQRNEGYKKSLISDKRLIAIPGGWVKKSAGELWHSTGFEDLKEHFGAPGSALRVEAGAVLFKKNPNSFIVALGGKGQLCHVPDARPLAEIMKRELVESGVPEEKILEEAESGTTYEQLKALMETAEKISPDEVIIVSNRYHLPRMEAMVACAPILKDTAKKFKIKFTPAEDILLESDPKTWKEILKAAYDSAEMKELVEEEKSGARQVREGKYRYPVKFSLRRVEPRDSNFLFNLRNDELVRRLSRQTELIGFDTHKKWFEKKMSEQNSVIFIAEDGSQLIAQTRFDFVGEDAAEVNIAVSADFRGKGYGTEILKEATNLFLASHPNIAVVQAFIKPENSASLKSFAKAGFILNNKVAAKNQEYVAMVLKK